MNTGSITRTIAIVVAVLMLVTTSSWAQRNRDRGNESRKARAELRNEMRTWFGKSVYPTLKQWHDAYDAQLSASDRATIQQLRSEARLARERLQEGLSKLVSAPRDERRDIADGIREDYRESMKSIIDRVTPIAKSSRTFLRDLFDKNEPQLDSWRDEARRMIDEWRTKNDVDDDRRRGDDMGNLPLLGGDGSRAALRFILWDGSLEQALDIDAPEPPRDR